MSRERTRSGPGAYQEPAGAYKGRARSIPGVDQERPRTRPGAHQDWARFTGSRARQGFPSKTYFSRGCKTHFFFEMYWKNGPFLFSGLLGFFFSY